MCMATSFIQFRHPHHQTDRILSSDGISEVSLFERIQVDKPEKGSRSRPFLLAPVRTIDSRKSGVEPLASSILKTQF